VAAIGRGLAERDADAYLYMSVYRYSLSSTSDPEPAMSRVTKKPVPKTPPPEAFGI
jgi:hypothetical protein